MTRCWISSTLAICPSGKRCPVQRQSPEAASQTLRELSSEPERRRWPSGLHAHAPTQREWPERVRRQSPEAASQTLRELSTEPERRRWPSGLHAHAPTQLE